MRAIRSVMASRDRHRYECCLNFVERSSPPLRDAKRRGEGGRGGEVCGAGFSTRSEFDILGGCGHPNFLFLGSAYVARSFGPPVARMARLKRHPRDRDQQAAGLRVMAAAPERQALAGSVAMVATSSSAVRVALAGLVAGATCALGSAAIRASIAKCKMAWRPASTTRAEC
jgi:hypothetical protein